MAKALIVALLAIDMRLLRATSGDCVGSGSSIHDIMADVGVDEPLGLLQMRKSGIAGDSEGQVRGEEHHQESEEGGGKGEGKGKDKCKGKSERGECSMWGDPHILSFDSQTQDLSLMAVPDADIVLDHRDIVNGIFWLVKSDRVQLQARFAKVLYPTAKANGTYLIGLAMSGPALRNNIVEVYPSDGKVFWNGEPILKAGGSQEFMEDGVVALRAFKSEDVNINKAHQAVASIEALFGSCMKLLVNRHSQHLNMRLTMPREEAGDGPMRGYCGNFNGNAEDDAPTLMSTKAGSFQVLREEEMLFSKVLDEDEEE